MTETLRYQDHLLQNASVPERAAASLGVLADRLVDPTRRMKDAYRIPAEGLVPLAWERSVDIWDERWPIERRQWVTDNWPRFEAIKGTLAGVRAFAALREARVVRAIVPPAKTFLSRAITAQERRAWLERFPQLRVYPFVARGRARFGTFAGAAYGLPKAHLGALYPQSLSARDRHRRETRLYEPRDGTETVLTQRVIRRTAFGGTVSELTEIALPGIASGQIFLGVRPRARLFFGLPAVAGRIVTLATERVNEFAIGQASETTLKPGLTPVSLVPETVAVGGARVAGQIFPGARCYLVGLSTLGSSAWQRFYERHTLFDPARAPDPRKSGRTHLGVTRLGMPPFEAEIRVEIRGKRPRRAVGRFLPAFTISADRRPLNDAVEAIAISRRLRDRILVDTITRRPLRAGDPIIPGATRIGQIVAA